MSLELSTLGDVVGALAVANGAARNDLSNVGAAAARTALDVYSKAETDELVPDVSGKADADLGNVAGAALAAKSLVASGATAARSLGQRLADIGLLEDFGASQDDPSGVDCAEAVLAMHAAGLPIRGRRGQVYGISGNCEFTTGDPWLEGVRLRQLSPGATTRTLFANGCDSFTARNVVVDRNGTGTEGTIADSAGAWFRNIPVLDIDGLTVTGDGLGNGLVAFNCEGRISRFRAKDIQYGASGMSAPSDDVFNAMWIIGGGLDVDLAWIENLKGVWSGQASPIERWTRAICVSGPGGLRSLTRSYLAYADQLLDLTGSDNPGRTVIALNRLVGAYLWGVKLANTAADVTVTGNVIERCGAAAVVVQAPNDESETPTGNVIVADNQILETGYGGVHTATHSVSGVRLMKTTEHPTDPNTVLIRGNVIDAKGAAMEYGILSDAGFAGNGDTWVEVSGNLIKGATVEAVVGVNEGWYEVRRAADQSIPNNAYTDVAWDTVVYDRMGGATGAAAELECTREGRYLLLFNVLFQGNTSGQRLVRAVKNGSLIRGSLSEGRPTASALSLPPVTVPFQAEAGDVVKVQVFQDSGGALNLLGGNTTAKLVFLGQGEGAS